MKSKTQLQGELKSKGTAWVMYLFLGCQYGYLNKWGVQMAYWLTLGGLGMWAFIDLFRINGLVNKHNNKIYSLMQEIDEKKHKETLEMLVASR